MSARPVDSPSLAARLLPLLLVFVPLAWASAHLGWGGVMTFAFAALAIIPLAGFMGRATETIADRLGAGIGGLLNATFGNAAELIIAFVALQRGYTDVVKASLTGSIIGNILLVLGISLVAGGAKRQSQTFDRVSASAGATMLALAAIGLIVPTVFHYATHEAVSQGRLTAAHEAAIEHGLSVEISVVLFAAYLLGLLFSLKTHRSHYGARTHDEPHPPHAAGELRLAVITLLVATALIAWMSEVLVGAVEAASHALGLTQVFVGVIVVAIVGNAAEHSTAVVLAMRDKIDVSLQIAIGSSIQIALFVAPVLVFASLMMPGAAHMDLRFSPFEVVAVLISVWIVGLVSQDGETNWLEGALLLAVYLILGMAFYFLP